MSSQSHISSRVGMQFFRWKTAIKATDHRLLGSRILGRSAEFLLDPFGTAINGILNLGGSSELPSAAAPLLERGRIGYQWVVNF